MGVLACDRRGCENIMCDFMSYEHGYLCWECREELVNQGPTDIKEFMQTEKLPKYTCDGWEGYVSSVFKSRYDEN